MSLKEPCNWTNYLQDNLYQHFTSIDEFREHEAEAFLSHSYCVEEEFKRYLAGKIEELGQFDLDTVNELVQQMLYEGAELYPNADADEYKDIDPNAICEQYNQLFDRSMLLLISPYEKQLTLEDDEIARKKQYNNFCRLYPGINQAEAFLSPVIVFHYDNPYDGSLRKVIHDFFQYYAPRSKKVIIVFNGHGNTDGMLFRDAPPVPIDKYISDVRDLLGSSMSLQSGNGVRLPIALDLVLAQCFGHLYSASDDDTIKVISFTRDSKPYSFFTISRENKGRLRRVSDSVHHDLNKYAKDCGKEVEGNSKVIEEPPTEMDTREAMEI